MSLAISTDVPYGNARCVSITYDKDLPEVSFAADPHGGPECLWFCFRLTETTPGSQRASEFRLVLRYFQNMLGACDPHNLRPVMKAFGHEWVHMEPGVPRPLPDGGCEAVWTMAYPDPSVDFALCYPYGPPQIDALLRHCGGYWRSDTIGISQAGHFLHRISNSYGTTGGETPGLYLIARQHSGETPGSWVLEGVLRYLAANGCGDCVVWAIPFANVDGIAGGDYGKDNFPYDLNRAWGRPPMRHETLVFQRDVARWKERCRPALAIDFHAPGACEKEGIFCYDFTSAECAAVRDANAEWAAAIENALKPEYAAPVFLRAADYASRWPTPGFTSYCAGLGISALTMETPYALARETLLTRKNYLDAGKRIADAIIRKLGMQADAAESHPRPLPPSSEVPDLPECRDRGDTP